MGLDSVELVEVDVGAGVDVEGLVDLSWEVGVTVALFLGLVVGEIASDGVGVAVGWIFSIILVNMLFSTIGL